MVPIVRLYASEDQARDAVSKLASKGFQSRSVLLLTPAADAEELTPAAVAEELSPAAGAEERVVGEAIRAKQIPGSHRRACTDGLRAGRSIVAVDAPFGAGLTALEVLESCDPIGTETLPAFNPTDATPLSDLLAWPVLTQARTTTQVSNSLTFGKNPLIKSKPMFGSVKSPKANRKSSFGLPLLAKSKPMFGSVKSPKRGWHSSFGIPLISQNAAPLSSIFGLPTVTKKQQRS